LNRWAVRQEVMVSSSRTRQDFARCLQDLAVRHYPDAEKIVLVMDNLNTHSLASLYAAFPPEQARSLAERFEIHYTPQQGSWLNMVELEIGVMSRQCLSRRIGTIEDMRELEVYGFPIRLYIRIDKAEVWGKKKPGHQTGG
jgi:hypothetical protein